MNGPIGVFDSGVGGTSIWKEIVELLPYEDTRYLADGKNAPYGTKSKEEILGLSTKNTELLLEMGCKIIIVACNTATTNAIDHLRQNFPVPFIGIEPAIKPAALRTKSKKVGVLATRGTLSSGLFFNTAKVHAAGIEVYEREGEGLVELVEAGKWHALETKQLLHGFLQPMLEEGIDCLVLGCTHYSYLIPVLKTILPKSVQIIDSGNAVAKQTQAVLKKNKLLIAKDMGSSHWFYSNTATQILSSLIKVKGSTVSFLDF